ncbi:unnamed protein product [Sphenostylis stenocarpa]|uniref:DCD domain-containing protein n=1 Tax=Sphenostylis stenocarpa TaxID=92480 RepID=A0AA86SA21_9FABA|nr:unnamed protein product [Sphenostylis stenocarpa]
MMKATRRTQSFRISGTVPFSPNSVVNSIGGRNLEKYQLGGVIFGCKNNTLKECQSKLLFGLPVNHFSYVKNIDPGLPIFLFNYSDRKLHGIFEASSKGKLYIDPYAWIDENSELDRTQYPAQVKVRIRLLCQPLSEDKFARVIVDNYYTHNHFWFELDHRQVNKLTSLLASLAVASGCNLKWKTISPSPPSTLKEDDEAFETPKSKRQLKKTCSTEITAINSLDVDIMPSVAEVTNENERNIVCEKLKKLTLDHESHYLSIDQVDDSPNENMCTAERGDNINDTANNENEIKLVYMKLKELTLGHGNQDLPMSDHVDDSPYENDACTGQNDINDNENDMVNYKKETCNPPYEHKYSIYKVKETDIFFNFNFS